VGFRVEQQGNSVYTSGYLEIAMHVPHRRHLNRIRCRCHCRRRRRHRRRHNPEVIPSRSVPRPTAPVVQFVHDGH
jgi:hypothetical protein